jgi:hypothetical protein
VLGAVIYWAKGHSIIGQYGAWRFQRNIEFTRFARLVVPYLYDTMNGFSLYSVFDSVAQRMEKEEDKTALQKLMYDMSRSPNDEKPFIDYANTMSGTDFSITFMQTLYDINQGLTDITVVENLSQTVSKQLMEGIEGIVKVKEHKFVFFPTKITMLAFVLIVGYSVAVIMYSLKDIHF